MHDRMGFIGGSDCYRIMNGEWHDLWLEKTGREQPDDLSDIFAVRLGTYTEEFHIRELERELGVTVKRQYQAQRDIEYVPCRATLDGVYGVDPLIGIECKHTNERQTMSKQLERYMPQLQFYMMVTGIERMVFSCIFGNREREHTIVDATKWYQHDMLVEIIKFWSYVKDDMEPDRGLLDVVIPKMDAVPINSMVAIDASTNNQFMADAEIFTITKDKAAAHEKAKKRLKEMMPSNCREMYCSDFAMRRAANGSIRMVTKEIQNAAG